MKKNFQYWLRWIGVLPFSILIGLLSMFPLHWVLYYNLSSFITPYPETPERLLTPFIAYWVIVEVSYRIAPEHKRITSSIIGTLLIIGTGILLIFGLFEIQVADTQFSVMYGGAQTIFGIIGASLGLILIYRKNSS